VSPRDLLPLLEALPAEVHAALRTLSGPGWVWARPAHWHAGLLEAEVVGEGAACRLIYVQADAALVREPAGFWWLPCDPLAVVAVAAKVAQAPGLGMGSLPDGGWAADLYGPGLLHGTTRHGATRHEAALRVLTVALAERESRRNPPTPKPSENREGTP
jgi:hypothetical protein